MTDHYEEKEGVRMTTLNPPMMMPLSIDTTTESAPTAVAPTASKPAARIRKPKLDVDAGAPARISPDKAVTIKPLAVGLGAVLAVTALTSASAYYEYFGELTGNPFFGLAIVAVVEVSMTLLLFASAVYRERGEHPFRVFMIRVVSILLTGYSMLVNFRHGDGFTNASDPVDYLTITTGATLPPLLFIICAHELIALFVKKPEGTRKQRASATAKREAAQRAAAHPEDAVAVAAPKSATRKPAPRERKPFNPEAFALAVEIYRSNSKGKDKGNDSPVKAALHEQFGIGRVTFEKHYQAAKREAGIL